MNCRVVFALAFFFVIVRSVAGECTVTSDAMFGAAATCSGTENALPDDHSGKAEFPDGGKVAYKGKTYEMEPGGSIAFENGVMTVEKGKAVETDSGTTAEDATRVEVRPDQERIESARRVSRPAAGIELEEPENVVIIPDTNDLTVEKVKKAKINDVVAYNAEGIVRRSGVLKIAKASKIEIEDGLLTDVELFEGTGIEFYVGAARDVVNGCLLLKGVWDSDFFVDDKKLVVQPKAGVSFQIADCRFAQSEFSAFSNDASLEISKSRSPSYTVKEGQLKCHHPGGTDVIDADNTATVGYGSQCFSCLTIEPSGTYWHNDQEFVRDFGVHIPDNASSYRLCLKRDALDYFVRFDGLVDYVENRLSLNGIVSYFRLPMENSSVTSLLMQPIYVGLDAANQADIQLDDELLFVDVLSLKNEEPSTDILSWVYHGPYGVYEHHQNNITTRYGRFLDGEWPRLIGEYRSDIGNVFAPPVKFMDNVLVQEGQNDIGTLTKAQMVCDDCSERSMVDEISNRLASLELNAGACGT